MYISSITGNFAEAEAFSKF